jgi:hypothetical protein
MTERERLPNRRPNQSFSFEHDCHRYDVTVGMFGDGRLAKIFIGSGKVGTAIEAIARDGAILISLLLQYGCALGQIQRALTRNADGRASGPLGALVDRVLPVREVP